MWGIWLVALPALAQDWRWSCDHEYCGVTLERLLEAPQVWVAEVEAYEINPTMPFVGETVATLRVEESLVGGVVSHRIDVGGTHGRPYGCGVGTRVLAFAEPLTVPVCIADGCKDVVVGDVVAGIDNALQTLLWEGPEGDIRVAARFGFRLCFNGVDFNHRSLGTGTTCQDGYDATFDDLVEALRRVASRSTAAPHPSILPGY